MCMFMFMLKAITSRITLWVTNILLLVAVVPWVHKEPVAKEPVYWIDFTLWDTATRYSQCGQKSYSIIFSRSSPKNHSSARDLFRQLVWFEKNTVCVENKTRLNFAQRREKNPRSGMYIKFLTLIFTRPLLDLYFCPKWNLL